MFKRIQTSSSVWTEKDLARLLLQARTAYEKDEIDKCNRMLELLLAADPGNSEARALRDKIHGTVPAILTWPEEDAEYSSRAEEQSEPAPVATPITPVAEPPKFRSGATTNSLKTILTIALTLIVGITAVLVIHSQPRASAFPGPETIVTPKRAPVPKPVPPPVPVAAPVEQVAVPVVSSIPVAKALTPSATPVSTPAVVPPAMAVADKPKPAPKTKNTAPASAGTGTLSVSSRFAADIYVDGKLVGSTPASIDLPAGTQAVEYRHGDLTKTVKHVINAGQTTAAMINFEVTVQINAKPWAHVFVEGAERQDLGQTPLSDVRVPVGATLTFENPNFTKKNYRVTGKETAIQVVFP